MKVLIVNSVPTRKSGITNVIFNYLSALDITGLTIDILAINNPDESYFQKVREKGGSLYVLPRNSKTICQYFWGLIRLIKKNKYDAVHIHGNSHTLVLELLAAKMAGCRIRIVHAHSTSCKYVIIHKIMTPLFNCLCTHRLACGRDAGIWMFGKYNFKVFNNGIDTERFAYSEKNRENIRNKINVVKSTIIGHVGYFQKVKNQTFLIKVFSELQKKQRDYFLVLIGDGPLRHEVEALAAKLDVIDRVLFTGNIDNVDAFLSAIDLIVMPSLFEGVPLTLVEQQANGLQCVVADTISKEVDKTGNIHYLSLDDNLRTWVDCIDSIECMKNRKMRSETSITKIKACGYDINTEAKKLREFYFNTCSVI